MKTSPRTRLRKNIGAVQYRTVKAWTFVLVVRLCPCVVTCFKLTLMTSVMTSVRNVSLNAVVLQRARTASIPRPLANAALRLLRSRLLRQLTHRMTSGWLQLVVRTCPRSLLGARWLLRVVETGLLAVCTMKKMTAIRTNIAGTTSRKCASMKWKNLSESPPPPVPGRVLAVSRAMLGLPLPPAPQT